MGVKLITNTEAENDENGVDNGMESRVDSHPVKGFH